MTTASLLLTSGSSLGTSDWVGHDEAERVNQLLIDFFAPCGIAAKDLGERP